MTPEQLAAKDSEDGHQAALFCQAALNRKTYPELKWMFAIPNGGNRDMRQGARLKMTGTKAGVWDVMLPVPIKVFGPAGFETARNGPALHEVTYHGLFIEMKKPYVQGKQSAGTLQPNQKEFRSHIEFFGYATVVCYTWIEAWQAIVSYLAHLTEEQRDQYRKAMTT